MRLPAKITLLLFAVITLFVTLSSLFFYRQVEVTFKERAEDLIDQKEQSIRQRIGLLQDRLESEVEQIARSIFNENEEVLSVMLSEDPVFNREVIGFAEKLRKRTNLDYLVLVSATDLVFSSSLSPAEYGTAYRHQAFPAEQPAFVFENGVRLQEKDVARFGRHSVGIIGGYFLRPQLNKVPGSGIEVEELSPETASPPAKPSPAGSSMMRTIVYEDYRGRPVLQITVRESTAALQAQKQAIIRRSTIFIVFILAACLLFGYLLSRWISRPLERIRDAAMQMSLGNLDVRVEDGGGEEIEELILAFNRMGATLEENQQKLLQTERVAAWQEIARHLAHEIKNPLTPIRTSIANLRLSIERAPEKFHEIFLESSDSILEEVEKLRKLADEFSRFARLPAPHIREGNLNEVVQKCLVLYGGEDYPSIEFNPGPIPLFPFDPEQLSEVIHNLLRNAVDATDLSGTIRVSTNLLEDGQWALMVVQDSGTGMDNQMQRQIFTPYFTTKEKGTGLGLAIVQRIIVEHGGKITLESEPGKGTTFEVRLPLRAQAVSNV